MSKKKMAFILCFLGILLNIFIINSVDGDRRGNIIFTIHITSDNRQTYQVFYSEDGNWNEEKSILQNYENINKEEILNFSIPGSTNFLRLDLGGVASNHNISNMSITYKKHTLNIDIKLLQNYARNMIDSISYDNSRLTIITLGNDPYIIIDANSLGMKDFINKIQNTNILIKNIIICFFIDILLMLVFKFRNIVLTLPIELYRNKRLILNLAKNDFRTKYAGSYFGIVWAFVQPIVTILTYWFVFQVGLKSQAIGDCPFVLWLIAGLIPWFFFADAVNGGMNSLIEYSYLVKKVVFKITILPIVKIISSLFIHSFFLIFMILLFVISGFMPSIYALQIIYYSFCMLILTLGISYVTSSLIVFFRDLGQLISIVLQIGMWLTPILWNYTMIPNNFLWLFKINPMYYIVEGFRGALINKVWFWENINMTIYFWVFSIVLFAVGSIIFKRLRVHFADVL